MKQGKATHLGRMCQPESPDRVRIGKHAARGLSGEPAEDFAGGFLIPTRGALVGGIDEDIPRRERIHHQHSGRLGQRGFSMK